MKFAKGYTPWNKGKCIDDHTAWNRGLTAKTDERVKRNGEHISIVKKGMMRGETNSFWGKHHTEKSIIKMSEAKKQQYKEKPIWNKDKTNIYSEETRKRIADACRGTHHSEESKRKMSELRRTPKMTELARNIRLSRIFPVKDTSIERKIQEELSNRELGFYKHIPICGICQPDVTFPDKKVAVFADGDYWHNLEKVKIRDAKQNETLRNQGWLVLRYWEHEINANAEAVVEEIEEIIIQRR